MVRYLCVLVLLSAPMTAVAMPTDAWWNMRGTPKEWEAESESAYAKCLAERDLLALEVREAEAVLVRTDEEGTQSKNAYFIFGAVLGLLVGGAVMSRTH